MDGLDAELLSVLERDARLPVSAIARELGVERHVAAYHLERLEENIIQRYVTVVDLGRLGYHTHKLYVTVAAEDREAFRDAAVQEQHIIHVLKTAGEFDYAVVVAAKHVDTVESVITRLAATSQIRHWETGRILYTRFFPLQKLLLGEWDTHRIERYTGSAEPVTVDAKERRILNTVSQSARIPLTDIAAETGLTEDTVRYRLDKLEDNGVLSYRPVIDLNALGFFHYVFLLDTKTVSEEGEQEIMTWCADQRHVLYVTKRMSPSLFEVNAAIPDIDTFNAFIASVEQDLSPWIDGYRLMVNAQLAKLDYAAPLT